MSRVLRLIAVVTGLALVVAIAGLVVVQSQLNPARLKEALERAVRRSTGRDLAIAGGLHLRMGLVPALEVDGVSLANLPGASRPQMLTAASLKANLALLPLLGGDVVIGALTVEQPDILLERLPDGTPNWQFSPVRRALYQGSPGGGSRSGGSGGRVEIRSITLKDGKLGWREASGQVLEFGIQSLDLASDGADQPMKLSAVVMHGGAPVTIEASSGSLEQLQGEAISKLAGTWPLTVDLTAEDASLHVEGGVNHPDEWRGYQFKVRGTVPDLAALDAVVPGTTLPALKQLAFSAVLLDGTEGALRTAQVVAQAGASDLGALVPGLTLQHLDLKAPGPGQIAQLSLDGSYSGAPMRASATAMQPDALTATRPIQVTLTAQAADATAEIHGTVPPSQAAAGLDLLVSLHAADLSQLSTLAGRTLPPAHDLALSAHATDAGFRLHGVSLGDIAVTSSLGDLSGALTVGWTPRPTLNGTLASISLDMDALWPAISEAAQKQEAAAPLAPPAPASAMPAAPEAAIEPAAWDPLPGLKLPVAALRAADGDLALTVGSLTAGGQRYRDLATHIQLAGGKLVINPFRVSSPQGIVVGGITIDASTDAPPVAVTLRSAALSASAVAGVLGEPGGAHGTVQLDAQLSGTGATSEALAATLDGHVGLAMVNGDIDNALVQTLVGSALDAAGAPSLGGGRSQVRCLALRLNISRGQGRLAAFALDTSRLSVDGTGSIDFAGRTLDLHLKPRLRLGGADASAPVSITGSFDDPKTRLDPVVGGSRFGFTIGSGADFDAGSICVPKLAVARGGLPGPMPAPAPALPDATKALRKLPTDLLRGLFH